VKVVVAGGGSVGRFTAAQLVGAGHEVTIIDNDLAVVGEYEKSDSAACRCWRRRACRVLTWSRR
jgi:Trk K+ transport system NAD-binding subunit